MSLTGYRGTLSDRSTSGRARHWYDGSRPPEGYRREVRICKCPVGMSERREQVVMPPSTKSGNRIISICGRGIFWRTDVVDSQEFLKVSTYMSS